MSPFWIRSLSVLLFACLASPVVSAEQELEPADIDWLKAKMRQVMEEPKQKGREAELKSLSFSPHFAEVASSKWGGYGEEVDERDSGDLFNFAIRMIAVLEDIGEDGLRANAQSTIGELEALPARTPQSITEVDETLVPLIQAMEKARRYSNVAGILSNLHHNLREAYNRDAVPAIMENAGVTRENQDIVFDYLLPTLEKWFGVVSGVKKSIETSIHSNDERLTDAGLILPIDLSIDSDISLRGVRRRIDRSFEDWDRRLPPAR